MSEWGYERYKERPEAIASSMQNVLAPLYKGKLYVRIYGERIFDVDHERQYRWNVRVTRVGKVGEDIIWTEQAWPPPVELINNKLKLLAL